MLKWGDYFDEIDEISTDHEKLIFFRCRNWWQNNGSNVNMHLLPIHAWTGQISVSKVRQTIYALKDFFMGNPTVTSAKANY